MGAVPHVTSEVYRAPADEHKDNDAGARGLSRIGEDAALLGDRKNGVKALSGERGTRRSQKKRGSLQDPLKGIVSRFGRPHQTRFHLRVGLPGRITCAQG